MPPSDLHPVEFAEIAAGLLKRLKVGLDVEVLDERALPPAAMGGILGVGQGSTNPLAWCGSATAIARRPGISPSSGRASRSTLAACR